MTKTCTHCQLPKLLTSFCQKTKKSKNGTKTYLYRDSWCTECNKSNRRKNRTKAYRAAYKARKKVEDPVRFHMQERIAQWRRKDPDSDLTVNYLVALWEQQKGLCFYSGMPMILGGTRITLWVNASLDRLDPSKGYKQGNLAWCTYKVNTMKGQLDTDSFLALCTTISVGT